jgi:LmbE family N-acetylglucosaminyl deacetylase
MAEHRRRGDRVVVVTATLGEHGTGDPIAWPPSRLAPLRRTELGKSLAAVGVDELHLLGLEDGTCEAHDGTSAIARYISELEPDLIVTFGPDGMTGHPDHRAVSHWVTGAWAATGSTAPLWYATLTDDFHARWGALNDEVGLWVDQPSPPCTPVAEVAYDLWLDDDLLDRKMAALRAHASQTEPLITLVGRATFREWWRTESFRVPTEAGVHS